MLASSSQKPLETKTKNKEGHTRKEEWVSQIYTHSPSLSISVGWTTATCAKASGRCEKLSLSSPRIRPSVPKTHWSFCFLSGVALALIHKGPGMLRDVCWERRCSLLCGRILRLLASENVSCGKWLLHTPTKSLAPFSGSFIYKMTTSPNTSRIPAVSTGSWNKKKPCC